MSNIVPYYSSSPPPLDDHSVGNDDDDDDFGDFSSAPSAINFHSTVKNGKSDKSDDNPFVFRPISPSEHEQEIDSVKSIAEVSSELVGKRAETLATDAGDASKIKESSAKNEDQRWYLERNEPGGKVSADLPYEVTSNIDHTLICKENSISCELKDSGYSHISSAKIDSLELSSGDDLTSEMHYNTAEIHNSHDDNLSPNSVQKSVLENDRYGIEIKLDQNVVDKDFSDFESVGPSVHNCQPHSLSSQVQEPNQFNSDICFSTKGSNTVDIASKEGEGFDEFQSSDASCANLSSSAVGNTKVTDFEHLQTKGNDLNELEVKQHCSQTCVSEGDDFADFDDFQIAAADAVKSVLVTNANDPTIFKTLEDQDDQELDCSVMNPKNESVKDQLDKQDDFNDFEECKSASDDLPLTEDSRDHDFETKTQEKEEKEEVIQAGAQSDKSIIAPDEHEGEEIGSDKDNFSDFDEFQFPSDEDLGCISVVEKVEIKKIPSAPSITQDSHPVNSEIGKRTENESEDFDDFDNFQVTSDPNSPRSNIRDVNIDCTDGSEVHDSESSWSAFGSNLSSGKADDGSWASFPTATSKADFAKDKNTMGQGENKIKKDIEASSKTESIVTPFAKEPQMKINALMSRVVANCYPFGKEKDSTEFHLLSDVIIRQQEIQSSSDGNQLQSTSFNASGADANEGKSNLSDICVWNHLKTMDLTAAFSFQWHTSSVSRNLLGAISISTPSILLGHKKQQNPLFAPNLGLLEPMKAQTEFQNSLADKDTLSFLGSDFSNASLSAASNTFIPQDMPQVEFDWGGSGLTNPLDATEKERELLDALEPASNESSAKLSPMSLETMLATLLPSIPSTQLIPKSQNVNRKQLSEEAVRVLAKLPDLSFMQAKVLMFPLKDTVAN